MSWVHLDEARRRLVLSFFVISLAAVCLWLGADLNRAKASVKTSRTVAAAPAVSPSTTFPGTGVGAIPDRQITGCGAPNGTPLDISFNVTGVTGTISNVSLGMTATHSWLGDLDVRLRGPGGSPDFVVFGSTGSLTASGCGSSGDLAGAYTFNNSAFGANWWSFGLTGNIPAGTYRTTVIGDQPAPPAGNVTDLTAAFAGVANPNGTWTLRITDGGGGDTGTVSAASLTIDTTASAKKLNDFDGDGKTDYGQIRDTSPGLNGTSDTRAGSFREKMQKMHETDIGDKGANLVPPPVGTSQVWFINRSSNNSNVARGHGASIQDYAVPADYDGDGKADIAIWRQVAAAGPEGAFFFVFNSSTSTVTTFDFGQNSDNPTVAGDYDGDGKADPAVFRCPPANGQCFFYYKGSVAAGPITYVPWGFGTTETIFPSAGDYDGDGKYDFNIQRTNPAVAGKGQFVLKRSSDNGTEFINWGNNTDLIIPGDYDGDGKTDINVGRSVSGKRIWFTLFRAGGSQQLQWGLSTDFVTPGDYDGDGKTDFAVFRPNADPDQNYFYVLRSSDSMLSAYEYGQNLDYPLANWQVN